jgi:hypothetical protein
MHPIDEANQIALARMTGAHPRLTGVARAGDVLQVLAGSRTLLHAGPPLPWERMSGPLRGALVGACLFEGWAEDDREAEALLASGAIPFSPCHHHGAVGPMAGVVSASMAVWVVETTDEEAGESAPVRHTVSTLNEGYGKVLRYGAYDADVMTRLRFLYGEMAEVLALALDRHGPIDLRALIAEALHMGDEGHNRNRAGSLLLLRELAGDIAAVADRELAGRVLAELAGNALAVLNPIMAACKAMGDAAHGVPHSTLITAMARNGTDIGLRVSGLGERWFTAPCATPVGLYFAGYSAADANPDIGDSTITETAGIGAFAMAAAPAIVRFIGGSPEDARAATLEMYEITLGEHPHFTIPQLGFRGTPVGIDLRKVVELGVTPRFNTGIAHRRAGVGQIGAGLVRPPIEPFVAALEAIAEALGV